MKALLIKGAHTIEWVEVVAPSQPDADEVIIQVKAAGICGTDVHILHGKHGAVTFPRIPGHELVGEVLAIGKDVQNIQVGQKVAIDPVVSCGQCSLCKKGRHNICHQVKCLGVQTDGGFTEVVKIKANRVYPFNPQVPWDLAALVEPYSIAAQIADRLRIEADDKVLIVGGGTIGLALLQIVQSIYKAQGIVADISPHKLAMAQEMGAYAVINPQEESTVQRAAEIWEDAGPTVIVEAVGHSGLLQTLIKEAPPGCRIGVIGFMADGIEVLPVEVTKKELEIIGSRMNMNKFPQVLKWFAEGLIDGKKLITHKFSFADAEKAFATIDENPQTVCKVILEF